MRETEIETSALNQCFSLMCQHNQGIVNGPRDPSLSISNTHTHTHTHTHSACGIFPVRVCVHKLKPGANTVNSDMRAPRKQKDFHHSHGESATMAVVPEVN